MMESSAHSDPQAARKDVTVFALGPRTLELISVLLNNKKIIPLVDNGLTPDWRGLSALCNLSADVCNRISQSKDPTREVLNYWGKDRQNTISKLLSHLEKLDRFDVIYDTELLIDADIAKFNQKPEVVSSNNAIIGAVENYVLTSDDVMRVNEGFELQHYDAFILFAEDDINFATQLIETMESQYNMKFCVRDRDLLGVGLEFDAIITLITERCSKLIVILSEAFFSSNANKFYMSFATSIGIEKNTRKVIHCVINNCELPESIKGFFLLDYARSQRWGNFWEKLNNSIKKPNQATAERFLCARSPMKTEHKVKFCSTGDITANEVPASVPELIASNSVNNLNNASKPKFSFLKKYLHKSSKVEKVAGGDDKEKKEKKKFAHKFRRRKEVLAES